MPDTDLHQPGLRAVRATAEIAELTQATTGLVTAAALRAGLGYPDAAGVCQLNGSGSLSVVTACQPSSLLV
jgi:hypothetical protein